LLPVLVFLGIFYFAIGSVVGSFLNVCIYRIPLQKSVIWPASRCPRCFAAIAGMDNIPIVSWIGLRGECRQCGLPISARYPLVEGLTGALFLGAFVMDVIAAPRNPWVPVTATALATAAYHCVFLAFLVVAALIDADLWIIPDEITFTGAFLGIVLGTIVPQVRPVPADAIGHWGAFWTGMLGLGVGAGLTFGIRQVFSVLFRKEALGLGDVTLMGMIGAYLGWQATVLTFFLGAFVGLGHALWKLVRKWKKRLSGTKLSSSDSELPYGPYLSMAAALLYFAWAWVWPICARNLFMPLFVIFWWSLGIYVDQPN
jgi:leader peptidase (prepilin peptidase) / N-methyltransferase